jgi:hypothetical protein
MNEPAHRLDEAARRVREAIQGLQQIHSTITVVVAALRQQASGLDEDIATVLVRGAADRIQDEVERLESVLEGVASPE